MEAKQKAIKAAYGKYYDSQCDDFGWVRFRPQFKNYETWCDAFPLDISEPSPGIFRYRPQSLRGIEDNNGWSKIEKHTELPKNGIECWIITKLSEDIFCAVYWNDSFISGDLVFRVSETTYFKIIEKPKPPIY